MVRTLTEVGRFIKEVVTSNPGLQNREVAERVVKHFPDQEFSLASLRQRVANFKFQLKKVNTAPVVTTTENPVTEGE